jgi:predicted nucleic acid-binding protein
MDLPDINVLIYAHREDAPRHVEYAAWLSGLATDSQPFALSSVTLSGFLRIVTNQRIFRPPTPMNVALAIEHSCELVTTDKDFERFPNLRRRHPLASRR